MVRARYIGEAEGDVSAYGVTFTEGKYADVPDQYLAKMLGNPHFQVQGAKKGDEPEPVKEPEPAPVPHPVREGEYRAEHRGRGRYSIMRGEEEVRDGLSRDDADAFNALSDDEKTAYVA